MITPLSSTGRAEHLILDVGDLVDEFKFHWNAILKKHVNDRTLVPAVEKVIKIVVDSIKKEQDAEIDLSVSVYHDILSVPHYDATPAQDDVGYISSAYSPMATELSSLTMNFGKAVVDRLRGDQVYRKGVLPYHYQGMVTNTVIVGLDITPAHEFVSAMHA